MSFEIEIEILPEHAEVVKDLHTPDEAVSVTHSRVKEAFGLIQCNYFGAVNPLAGLTDELEHRGVAFNMHWEDNDSDESGYRFVRFDENGKARILEFSEKDKNIHNRVLMHIINTTGGSVIRLAKLEAVIRKKEKETVPISWSNQAEYGLRYRARQLIIS